MVDTHAHLTEYKLYNNLDEVIKNAKDSGVNKIICVGMNKKANDLAINIANNNKMVYATVGIHPNEVMNEQLDITLLEELTKEKKVIAIGEIGIDLYRSKDSLIKQKEYFIKQIELALKLDLPIIVHSRNSADVIYDIVKDYKNLKGVMHCYSEHVELVDKFVELGFYIGIGGIVTFKNAHLVRDIAKKVPLEKLLIETDAPYLAPDPFRGKTNEPAYVKYTLLKLAEVLNIDKDELINVTTANAHKLFTKMND